jgi:MFS family permease
LIIQAIFNAYQIYYNSIFWLCLCRFICGFCHNLNTIGKDFVFEFALPEYRQYAYSLKSTFGIFGSFVGPLIGYMIYIYSGRNFFWSCVYVSMFYLVGLIFFFILFYLNYIPGEIEQKIALEK